MKVRQSITIAIIALLVLANALSAGHDSFQGPFSVAPLAQPLKEEPIIEDNQELDERSLLDVPQEYTYRSHKRKAGGRSGKMVAEFFSTVFSDVFYLNVNLFTWNSFKIVAATFPAFIAARMIDDKLHRCFYDKSCHKNINQLPNWCQGVARAAIGVPIVLLGFDAFFSKIDERRWTSQILLLGIPFVIWTKKLIKLAQFDGCQRPWNEFFDCENRSYGGFPSGHMAQALYMAVLFGTRYGPRMAVPLGLVASFIGVTFVTCNRHYLSQVVAGSVFGTLYALAASKLVDMKLADRVKLRIKVDEEGRPTLSAGISW